MIPGAESKLPGDVDRGSSASAHASPKQSDRHAVSQPPVSPFVASEAGQPAAIGAAAPAAVAADSKDLQPPKPEMADSPRSAMDTGAPVPSWRLTIAGK